MLLILHLAALRSLINANLLLHDEVGKTMDCARFAMPCYELS